MRFRRSSRSAPAICGAEHSDTYGQHRCHRPESHDGDHRCGEYAIFGSCRIGWVDNGHAGTPGSSDQNGSEATQ